MFGKRALQVKMVRTDKNGAQENTISDVDPEAIAEIVKDVVTHAVETVVKGLVAYKALTMVFRIVEKTLTK